MSEVGGPLAEVGEHRRLDRLDSFWLFGVVGYPMLGAVGVRHKQRPFAVVAAPGAHRFAFFLPRRARASSAPFSGVLTRFDFAQLRRVVRGALPRVVHALLRSRGVLSV